MSDHADLVFINGRILAANNGNSMSEALAIKDGLIAYAGNRDEAKKLLGPGTELVDLKGNSVIPGLIDCHAHPLWGAKTLASHSLGYESLSVSETLAKVEGFLREDGEKGDDEWLKATSWLRVGGTDVFAADLDKLPTRRPVILFSNDCHFAALNSRGLELLGIDQNTPDPPDGNILRDKNGKPTGIVEDAPAMRYYDQISEVKGEEASRVFSQAFKALNAQGVTAIMDARALEETFSAIKFVKEKGALTVRFFGAREIPAADCPNPGAAEAAVLSAKEFIDRFDEGEPTVAPGISLKTLKFFVDGMPTCGTAYLGEPYFENLGSKENPNWKRGIFRGEPYFSGDKLKALFTAAVKYGLNPHCHVIGDGAAALVLDALEIAMVNSDGVNFRPALAHLDIMTADIYERMAKAKAIAVLSFQWSGQPDELIELQRNLFGPERFEGLETHAKFIDAGVKVAYGSDWPIDPLNEWANFQVGLTRRMIGKTPEEFARLSNDRDLTLAEALTAATENSAFVLGFEKYIGSLRPGKFADLAVIEGDLFKVRPFEVAKTKVLRTLVGGKTVYTA
jgi:predicted amidohydrolase YtcJ